MVHEQNFGGITELCLDQRNVLPWGIRNVSVCCCMVFVITFWHWVPFPGWYCRTSKDLVSSSISSFWYRSGSSADLVEAPLWATQASVKPGPLKMNFQHTSKPYCLTLHFVVRETLLSPTWMSSKGPSCSCWVRKIWKNFRLISAYYFLRDFFQQKAVFYPVPRLKPPWCVAIWSLGELSR